VHIVIGNIGTQTGAKAIKLINMRSTFFIERENKILKHMINYGFFWVNYSSTDCDGCSSEYPVKFDSLEGFYEHEEKTAECADGPFAFSLADVDENGNWDLVKEHKGGSW
jgi:hypothetical protein